VADRGAERARGDAKAPRIVAASSQLPRSAGAAELGLLSGCPGRTTHGGCLRGSGSERTGAGVAVTGSFRADPASSQARHVSASSSQSLSMVRE